ncbi:MAG: endonuclease III [Lachnospiraceae bacterium]|nr:endonuclease III [Lachnospiraceae bacterium]
MTKKDLALEVIRRLKKEYPRTECTLDYDDAWKLLVSVRLAAQCTDERVNRIVPGLFARFPDPKALGDADVNVIEEIVRPCGLGPSKARDIKACMQELVTRFDGKVPDTMEELLSLPGVGRKSANLILGDVFGQPAVVTDTHCIRLSNRIGLVKDEKDPAKVEAALRKIVPPEEGNDLCHRFVDHGRAVCTARTDPFCDKCVLKDICAYAGKRKTAAKPSKKA